jgi:hypothetical protein
MAVQTDVTAKSLAATGEVYGARTRVKGFIISPSSSAGNVALTDGGVQKIFISTVANGEAFNVVVPGDGVVFQSNVAATLNNTSITVFYG